MNKIDRVIKDYEKEFEEKRFNCLDTENSTDELIALGFWGVWIGFLIIGLMIYFGVHP